MDNEYLLNFLKEKNVATIKKKKHTYLTYYGLEQQDTYVLKDGVVKTSVILPDGREFNISYINTPRHTIFIKRSSKSIYIRTIQCSC